MPLSLLNHSALALFAQRTRIPTSARSIGFCAIWVCISSSSEAKYSEAHQQYRDIIPQGGVGVRSYGSRHHLGTAVQ